MTMSKFQSLLSAMKGFSYTTNVMKYHFELVNEIVSETPDIPEAVEDDYYYFPIKLRERVVNITLHSQIKIKADFFNKVKKFKKDMFKIITTDALLEVVETDVGKDVLENV